MSEFQGRTALVTGGATGIGRAICLRLAAGGARVAINCRSRPDEAAAVAEEIAAAGGQAMVAPADLTQAGEVADMRAAIDAAWGPVELLVNNAGRFSLADPATDTPEHLEEMFRTNVRTTFVTTHAMKDAMLERGFGRIVNITSVAARNAMPQALAYAVAKAGVIALTHGWAQAWGGRNVRVNCVAPGFIETEANTRSIDPAFLERARRASPMQRGGEPQEPADAVAFLLSEASSFINGQTLAVCGGRLLT